MTDRYSGPTVAGPTTELVLFVVISFGLSYAAVAQTTLAAAGCAVVAIALSVVMSMRSINWAWTVYFLAICANGVQTSVSGLTVRPEYFAAPILIVALYLHRPSRGDAQSQLNGSIYLGLFGFVTVAIASSFLAAPDTGASLRMCVQLVIALAVVIPLGLSTLNLGFVVFSGTVVLSVISVASIGYFLLDPSRRISGLAFEYNVMGALCVGWLGVLFYFASDKAIVTRHVVALAAPIVAALILTSTRSAWLALSFGFVFWVLRNVSTRPVTVVASMIGAVLTAAYLQEIYHRVGDEDTFLWRVVHIADTDTGTGAYRVQLWGDAIQQIVARDWTVLYGTGLNSFTQFNPIDPTNVTGAYLSSTWIALVYDTGVVGAAFFVLLVVALFVAVDDKWRALPLFVGLAVCTSVTSVLYFAFPWTFIALLVCASRSRAGTAAIASSARPRRRRVAAGAHRVRRARTLV